MRNKVLGFLLAAVMAAIALSANGIVANGSTPAPSNSSNQVLNLFKAGVFNDGTGPFAWGDNVIGSTSSTDINSFFNCPSTASEAWVFVSTQGMESDKTTWEAYAPSAFVTPNKNIQTPNLKLSGLTNGTVSSVKSSGGTWSLGVACTEDFGATVDYAAYRTINVVPSSGVWSASPSPTIGTTTPVQSPNTTSPASPSQTTSPGSSSEIFYTYKSGSYVGPSSTGTPFGWQDNVIGSTSKTDINSTFSCPNTATDAWVFVSQVGLEFDRSSWTAYAPSAFVASSKNIQTPNVKLSGLTNGTVSSVKSSGGNWSLGVACTEDSGATVDYASFRAITVTADSGVWVGGPETGGSVTHSPSATATPSATPTSSSTATPTSSSTATPSSTPTSPPAAILPVRRPSWFSNQAIYQVNVRQATASGTFLAFQSQIPTLKALGVRVLDFLPLNPISNTGHLGTLGSPYAIDDYHFVNPEFITQPRGTEAEFTNLVYYAHQAGMKVIVGWNAQATGLDNPWLVYNKSWYQLDGSGKPLSPDNGIGLETDKALLNYGNSDMRAAMVSEMKYWVAHFGIDGFACANAVSIPVDFWDRITAEVNAVANSPLLWLADGSTPSLLKNSFVAAYNNDLFTKLNGLPSGRTTKSTLMSAILASNQTSSAPNFTANFTNNDIQSAYNGSDVTRLGAALKVATVLQFTSPGVPFIYNGQEVGLSAKLKTNDKTLAKWPTGSAALSFSAFYKKLLSLRSTNPALALQNATAFEVPNSSKNVLSFARSNGSNKILVIANLASKSVKVAVRTSAVKGSFFDLMTSKGKKIGDVTNLNLAKNSFVVYTTTAVK